MRTPTVVKVMAILGVVWVGCDGDDELPVVATGITDGGVASAPIVVTDPQGAQVVLSLNAGEIVVAQSVEARFTTAPTMDFATRMIAEHGLENRIADDLFAQQGIAPIASSLSQSLDLSAASLVFTLGMASPPDTPYIVSQVGMHVQTLGLLDCLLIPDAQDPAYRDFLIGTLRPTTVEHLRQASVLAGAVAPTNTAFDCSRLCMPGTLYVSVSTIVCP